MDNQGSNKCGTSCAVKKTCPVKGCLLRVLAVFSTIFLFEWLFHHVIMMPGYLAAPWLWRAPADMQQYFYIIPVRQFITALVVTCLFSPIACQADGKCLLRKGLRFGFLIGLLLGITNFSTCAYMPIPLSMAFSWLAGNIVMGLLIGLVLGLCHKMKKGKADNA